MGLAMSLNLDIDSLPPEKVEAVITRLEAEKAHRVAENKLAASRSPSNRSFTAGTKYRERLFIAGNQVGKSRASHEVAAHTSGLYPSWWPGFRFDRAIRAWACGETAEVVRETMQWLLLGAQGQYGTGAFRRPPWLKWHRPAGSPTSPT